MESIKCSLLMYLGVAIFSPSIAIAQWLGAIIGCFTALLVGPPSFHLIYIGVWSYSALLTAGATVYFTQPSIRFPHFKPFTEITGRRPFTSLQ